jgi:glycosyltransferase involved in cell wall biosynthesis
MKILHIIDSAGLYGAEVVLLNLAEEQKRMGHYPVIASIGEKGQQVKPLEEEASKRGIEVAAFRMQNGPNPLGAWRIYRYSRVNGFDVLHTHGYKGDILFGFIPKGIRRIPLISTVHGWTNVERFSKLRVYECLDGLSLRFVDAVCTVNEVMRDDPKLKRVSKAKVHVVTNGIPLLDMNKLEPEDEIVAFCRSGFTVASIGRFSKEKGYDYLIQAFAGFAKEAPEARLLIIGEGPERACLEEMVLRMGLYGKVMLPGYRENAWRYLSCCKLFVLSSLTEGLPITLLEAMQTGVPVVATAVGGIPQLIVHDEHGLLVPPCDTKSLCQSITRIYQHEDLAKGIAQNAKNIVLEKYSSRMMALGYDAVYHSLTHGHEINKYY